MLAGVQVVCFASSYAVALALEISRLFFRSGVRGAVMLVFGGAGLLAHTLYLANRTVIAVESPLSSNQDWCLLAAWALAIIYLYLTVYHPKTPFGLFILPSVLGLIGAAYFWADSRPFAREPASRIWALIHGMSILLATVAVLVGFAAGLMYLRQARRLKRKLPSSSRLRLPSLEWLRRANSRALVVSLIMVGIGILSGVVLNLLDRGRPNDRLAWTDPVILTTLLMFAWLLVSVVAGLFYRPAREGHKVVYVTLVSFVFLVLALSAFLSLGTGHGGNRRGEGSRFRVQGSGFGPSSSFIVHRSSFIPHPSPSAIRAAARSPAHGGLR